MIVGLLMSVSLHVLPEQEVREVARTVEASLEAYPVEGVDGYSDGEMPTVVLSNCGHPALAGCRHEGSHSWTRRSIVVDSSIEPGCRAIVVAFEVARDALSSAGVTDREAQRRIATWSVGRMVLEDGGFGCTGRVTWETSGDRRMGSH